MQLLHGAQALRPCGEFRGAHESHGGWERRPKSVRTHILCFPPLGRHAFILAVSNCRGAIGIPRRIYIRGAKRALPHARRPRLFYRRIQPGSRDRRRAAARHRA